MKVSEAILSFSQSEKIKSGLIWLNQLVQMSQGLAENQRHAASGMLQAMAGMIGHEVHITKNLSWDQGWEEAEKSINMALVMIRSGVPEESTFHITQALSHVTSLGQGAMEFLKQHDLL